eukprot:2416328-Amphidinium_carterae.1
MHRVSEWHSCHCTLSCCDANMLERSLNLHVTISILPDSTVHGFSAVSDTARLNSSKDRVESSTRTLAARLGRVRVTLGTERNVEHKLCHKVPYMSISIISFNKFWGRNSGLEQQFVRKTCATGWGCSSYEQI